MTPGDVAFLIGLAACAAVVGMASESRAPMGRKLVAAAVMLILAGTAHLKLDEILHRISPPEKPMLHPHEDHQ